MTALRQLSTRPIKCKAQGCDNKFVRSEPFQEWCSPACGYQIACKKLAQKRRKHETELRKKFMTLNRERIADKKAFMENDRKRLNASAQRAFNRWIRLVRDDGLPCQSCGKPLPKGPSHDKECGHFKSRGAHPRLRFDESNCAVECHRCNHHSDSHLIGLKASLIRRFGQKEMDRLESSGGPYKFSLDELRAIRDEYLKRNREAGL